MTYVTMPTQRCSGGRMPPPPWEEGGHGSFDAALLAAPVLVVEDEAMIAWMTESLLEDLGFTRVAIAASGEAAITQATRVSPRLIVSDINLGPAGMDGVEAVVAMLAVSAASVVFVSGHISPEARSRIARQVPGAVLVGKPIGPHELRRAIETATQVSEQ